MNRKTVGASTVVDAPFYFSQRKVAKHLADKSSDSYFIRTILPLAPTLPACKRYR